MQNSVPDLSHYTEPVQHYNDAYARALARHDYAGLVDAQWGLIAKGTQAIPYALNLLHHEDYQARAAGASILGSIGEANTGPDEIVMALVGAIRDELRRPEPTDGHEREALDAMVLALTQLGRGTVIPALGRLISDPQVDSEALWAAVEAVDTIVGGPLIEEDNLDLVTAVQEWLSEHS